MRCGPGFTGLSPASGFSGFAFRPTDAQAMPDWPQPFRREVKSMLNSLYLRLRELLNREEGQGMVEYALILVLIAVVVIVVLIILGNQVKNVFCNISGGLGQ
jgi:pilus assembly protein Flp/PilA